MSKVKRSNKKQTNKTYIQRRKRKQKKKKGSKKKTLVKVQNASFTKQGMSTRVDEAK